MAGTRTLPIRGGLFAPTRRASLCFARHRCGGDDVVDPYGDEDAVGKHQYPKTSIAAVWYCDNRLASTTPYAAAARPLAVLSTGQIGGGLATCPARVLA
jgi:hypothetical protein